MITIVIFLKQFFHIFFYLNKEDLDLGVRNSQKLFLLFLIGVWFYSSKAQNNSGDDLLPAPGIPAFPLSVPHFPSHKHTEEEYYS